MSGITPQWSTAKFAPVRPKPVITSSAMKRISLRSQISRIFGKYSGTGGTAPSVAPTTGSAMKAATFSGPCIRTRRSR